MSSTIIKAVPLVSPKTTLIRVKRRADEERTVAAKRCRFVGTTQSVEDKDIYSLLSSTKTLTQTVSQTETNLKIFDYDEIFSTKITQSNEIITCNGQPLDIVDSSDNQSDQYLYDIYVYENDDNLETEELWKDYRDSDNDSNDEDYAYNDYPDEYEVPEDAIDYYEYRDCDDKDNDSDLGFGLHITSNSSDYELDDENVDPFEAYRQRNRHYCESDNRDEDGDNEDNDEDY
ncbi:protein PFC0760c-like [Oppia nitens]|uniref:protein PFC0760c-like n=1 Tax=Oppia nitens TaxID=1686743 RepID=UPI0023DC3D17|nr:protein PFC0760c-like [Oppia nitens]